MRTVTEARAAARAAAKRPPDPAVVGMCLREIRTFYGVGARHPSAAAAFRATRKRGRGPAPAGALHWWLGGPQGFGHVVLGQSPTRVWTTDNARRGGVDLVTLTRIARTWPSLSYAGWTRDINGVTVVPAVRLRGLAAGPAAQADVAIVVRALREEGLYTAEHIPVKWEKDAAMVVAYAAWQERAGFGPATPFRPGPADGLPGIRSLTALGLRRGFVVR